MKDPKRLLVGWNDDLGRAALQSAAFDAPPPGAKERALVAAMAAATVTAAATTAAIATTAGAASAASTASTAAPAAYASAFGLMKTLGIMSLVGVSAMGAALYVSSSPPRVASVAPALTSVPSAIRSIAPAATPRDSSSLATASAAPSVSATPSAFAAPSASATIDPSVNATPRPSSTTTPLVAELAAIDEARRALESGQPARALALLDAYATAFPRGSLGAEATVLRIEALLAAGDRTTAVALGQRFLATSPSSTYAPRVRSLIGETAQR